MSKIHARIDGMDDLSSDLAIQRGIFLRLAKVAMTKMVKIENGKITSPEPVIVPSDIIHGENDTIGQACLPICQRLIKNLDVQLDLLRLTLSCMDNAVSRTQLLVMSFLFCTSLTSTYFYLTTLKSPTPAKHRLGVAVFDGTTVGIVGAGLSYCLYGGPVLLNIQHSLTKLSRMFFKAPPSSYALYHFFMAATVAVPALGFIAVKYFCDSSTIPQQVLEVAKKLRADEERRELEPTEGAGSILTRFSSYLPTTSQMIYGATAVAGIGALVFYGSQSKSTGLGTGVATTGP